MVSGFILSQPIASLAHSGLADRQLTGLFSLSVSESPFTIRDADDFLRGKLNSVELRSLFNTEVRLSQLERALQSYISCAEAADGGDAIAPPRLRAVLEQGRLSPTVRHRLGSTDLGRRLLKLEDLRGEQHIASLLLGLTPQRVHTLRQLRMPDLPVLEAAARKGCQANGIKPRAPWDPAYPARLHKLPLAWLYQFDPRKRMLTLIENMTHGTLVKVRHLQLLDPAVLHLVRRGDLQPWLEVRASLAG